MNMKRNKCVCGKTKDKSGNCVGSHANTSKIINYIVFTIAFLFSSFAIATNLSYDKEVNVKLSNVFWKGEKVTGSHEGNISLKSGVLKFDDNKLAGGNIVINMNTIDCTDLSGEYKSKLEGHLKSNDFFGVEEYPEAILQITKVRSKGKSKYECMADLTIKGVTKEIKFEVELGKGDATTNIVIDRTKFNVKYGSGSFFKGLGDKMIYDEFEISVDLVY
jgi:polyisoprenoid-binding protein YceI